MESLPAESRIPKMAVCGVKVGKIVLFWKHWTKSAINIQHDHIHNKIWKGVLSYKLQKKHSGNGFILKV